MAAAPIEPSAMVKGVHWGGSRTLAYQIANPDKIGGVNALAMIDSLATWSYDDDNGEGVGFNSSTVCQGIVAAWDVPIAGIGTMCADQTGGNQGHLYTVLPNAGTMSGSTYTPGTAHVGAGIAADAIAAKAYVMEFTADSPDYTRMLSMWITAARGAAWGLGDWTSGKALVGRFVHWPLASGASLLVEGIRPWAADGASNVTDSEVIDTSVGSALVATDVAIGLDGNDADPGLRVRIPNNGVDETGKWAALVAAQLRLADSSRGLTITAAGLSGKSVKFHIETYTAATLAQLFTALGIDLVIAPVGANGGLNTDKAEFKADLEAFCQLCWDAWALTSITPRGILLLGIYANETGTADDAEEINEAVVEVAEEASGGDVFGVGWFWLGGEDTSAYRVDTIHTNNAGAAFFMGKTLELLRRVGNEGRAMGRGTPDGLRLGRRFV